MLGALRFREARLAAGFSLRQAGQRLGKTASAVQKWESGANSPTVPDIFGMSDVYGVAIGGLFGESDNLLTSRHVLGPKSMTIDALLDQWSRQTRIAAEKAHAKQLAEIARLLPLAPTEFVIHWTKALGACAAMPRIGRKARRT